MHLGHTGHIDKDREQCRDCMAKAQPFAIGSTCTGTYMGTLCLHDNSISENSK